MTPQYRHTLPPLPPLGTVHSASGNNSAGLSRRSFQFRFSLESDLAGDRLNRTATHAPPTPRHEEGGETQPQNEKGGGARSQHAEGGGPQPQRAEEAPAEEPPVKEDGEPSSLKPQFHRAEEVPAEEPPATEEGEPSSLKGWLLRRALSTRWIASIGIGNKWRCADATRNALPREPGTSQREACGALQPLLWPQTDPQVFNLCF